MRAPRRQPFRPLVSDRYRSMFFFALSIRRQIGDERSVPANWRDDQVAELARELAREDAELAVKDGDVAAVAALDATPEQLEVTLDRLRQLHHRIDQRQLEPDDWALLAALIRETT